MDISNTSNIGSTDRSIHKRLTHVIQYQVFTFVIWVTGIYGLLNFFGFERH